MTRSRNSINSGFEQFFYHPMHPDEAIAHGVDILGFIIFGNLGIHLEHRSVNAEYALPFQFIQVVNQLGHRQLSAGAPCRTTS